MTMTDVRRLTREEVASLEKFFGVGVAIKKQNGKIKATAKKVGKVLKEVFRPKNNMVDNFFDSHI